MNRKKNKKPKIQLVKIRPLEIIDGAREYKQIIILFLQKLEQLTGVERKMITNFIDTSGKTVCLLKK